MSELETQMNVGDVEPEGGEDLVTLTRREFEELLRGDPTTRMTQTPASPAEPESSMPTGTPASRTSAEPAEAATDAKAEYWRTQFTKALRQREIAQSLAAHALVAGAARQLMKLWDDDFEVLSEGGEHRVVSKDGRSIEEVIRERLKTPDYLHFCREAARAGPDQRGGQRSTGSGPQPRNLGETVIMQWRQNRHGSSLANTIGLKKKTY